MPYSKKLWTLEDPITDVALNNIENGVANAHTVLDATGTPLSLSGDTGNIVGTATAKAKADHTHALLANGTPSTQAIGDAATVGSSAHLARADHKHGMPSFGTGPTNVLRGTAIMSGTTPLKTIQPGEILEVQVTFPSAMPSTPKVVLCPANTVGSIQAAVVARWAIVNDSVTTTGFTFKVSIYPNDQTGVVGFNWIAVST